MRLVVITVEPLPLRLLSRLNRTSLDLLHIFNSFQGGALPPPGRARPHAAQGRVDPHVAVEPHPLVDPLLQMLGVGKRLAVDEPPLQAVVGRLDHGVAVQAALLRQGPLDAEASSISSIEASANSLPRSVWKTLMSDRGHGGERRLRQVGVAPAADRVPDDLAVARVNQQANVAPLSLGAHVRQVAYDIGARLVPIEAPVEQVRQRGLVRLRAGRPVPFPREGVASFIGSPFHECGVAAGSSDTAIVDLIRGYVCRRGFHFLCPAHIVLREGGSRAAVYFFGALSVCVALLLENVCCAPRLLIIGGFVVGLFEHEY